MPLSRRDLIRSSAVIGGAVALTGAPAFTWPSAAEVVAPQYTTLEATLVRGPAGPLGYTPVVTGPGQEHVVREEIFASAGANRANTRTIMLAFAQLTDVHIVDPESPLRLEFVDRLDDVYGGGPTTGGLLTSSYRAQELTTTHVADSMVQAINRVGVGPVTGTPLAFAIQTGDNSDNCQFNEVRWNIDVLDGKQITPASGNKTTYEGVMDAKNKDRHYWKPVTPTGQLPDFYKSKYGFPDAAGLIEASQQTYEPEGLNIPWYAAFGNHDGLVQGNFPLGIALRAVSTGRLKVDALPPGLSEADVFSALNQGKIDPLLGAISPASARIVTRDHNRRQLTRRQVVNEHFNTTGLPKGHGFTAKNRLHGTAYYTFDAGPIRCIVMDTVNPNGYYEGSLDQAQFGWLKGVLALSKTKYVMVFSHHTAESMANPIIGTGLNAQPRVLGGAVVDLFLANKNVIAWVNGHTHRNEVTPHKASNGQSGFWEINTASHIDFPQQSRLIEVCNNGDGTLSLFGTMLDHAAPLSHGGSFATSLHMAALSRELSANDPQLDVATARGANADRNVELLLNDPLA